MGVEAYPVPRGSSADEAGPSRPSLEPHRPGVDGRRLAMRRLGQLLLRPPLWVAILTVALYLPSSARYVQLSADMVEYVDIARRLVDGEGYLLGIKAYHVGGSEVVQDGLYHRPPLLTLGIAALLGLGLDLHAVQAVHTLVGALAAALVCSIGIRLFGPTVGIAAGILAAASPIAFKIQVPLMTEALATALILAGVRVLVGAVDRPTVRAFALAGVVFGLGYLARPPVLAVFFVATAATVLAATERRRLVRPLGALLAGLALLVVPMSLFSLVTRGRLVYSGKTYLYAVTSDRAVMDDGFVDPVPTPVEFITANLDFIARSSADLAAAYATWLFLDAEWLLLLLPAWPFALAALLRGQYPRAAWIALAAAAANYVFYVFTWASWQDRFMLPTLFLLLPFAVDGLFRGLRLGLRVLPSIIRASKAGRLAPTMVGGLVVALIALSWFPKFTEQYRGRFWYFDRATGTRTDAGLRWTGPPRWVGDNELEDVVAWIDARTGPDAVLAHGQPWPYSFLTRRPSVMLPINLSKERLRDLAIEYRVSYMLIDGRDRWRRGYRDHLEELADEGVRPTRLGPLIAFDTRALWE